MYVETLVMHRCLPLQHSEWLLLPDPYRRCAYEQRPGPTQWQTIHLLPDTLGTDAWPEYSGPAPHAVPVATHNRHTAQPHSRLARTSHTAGWPGPATQQAGLDQPHSRLARASHRARWPGLATQQAGPG